MKKIFKLISKQIKSKVAYDKRRKQLKIECSGDVDISDIKSHKGRSKISVILDQFLTSNINFPIIRPNLTASVEQTLLETVNDLDTNEFYIYTTLSAWWFWKVLKNDQTNKESFKQFFSKKFSFKNENLLDHEKFRIDQALCLLDACCCDRISYTDLTSFHFFFPELLFRNRWAQFNGKKWKEWVIQNGEPFWEHVKELSDQQRNQFCLKMAENWKIGFEIFEQKIVLDLETKMKISQTIT